MEWDAQEIRLAIVAPLSPTNHISPGAEEGVEDEDEMIEVERGMGDEGLVELWGKETWSEKVAKWLFCGDDRNTRRVYVRGRLVYERR